MTDSIARLKKLIHNCQRAVVFTGAGVSTESGIPDFRSPGGIWSKHTPIDFKDFVASADARRDAWRLKFMFAKDMKNAKPNRGHRAIASLVAKGLVSHVVTQNVDGLHQVSGVPVDQMIELHGNATYAHCLDCGQHYDLVVIQQNFERDESLPICDHCDGLVKTATISFGQAMPEAAMLRAHQAATACDLFIVVGSSLVVYPAADIPRLAKQHNAQLVIINRDPTDFDSLADLVIHEGIGEVLGEAVSVH